MLRCRGKSYLDLLAQRAGACEDAPDAVVAPADHDQVLAVLQACDGGGRGGRAVRRRHQRGRRPRAAARAVRGAGLARPRRAWTRLLAVDERSLTAMLAPGMRLPEADRALAAHGLTLGHLPQSYEWATVGGCVATRSAGQASTGHGRIDENLDRRAVSRRRSASWRPATRRPAPRGRRCGSSWPAVEGVLGVDHGAPRCACTRCAEERYEGWLAAGLRGRLRGAAAARAGGAAPDVARLSDEDETRYTLALRRRCAGRRAASRGEPLPDDPRRRARPQQRRGERRCAAAGGARYAHAASPGERWAHSRFDGPHLRDDLLDRGVMVETLETATSWSNLAALHEAVRAALPGLLVGCHVSHLYPDRARRSTSPCSAAASDDPAAQWRAAKAAATDAIVAAGGTITHHHAVGRDHAPWMGAEVGELGRRAAAGPEGPLRPGRDHEPGEASMSTACSGASSGICRPAVASARPGQREPVRRCRRRSGSSPGSRTAPGRSLAEVASATKQNSASEPSAATTPCSAKAGSGRSARTTSPLCSSGRHALVARDPLGQLGALVVGRPRRCPTRSRSGRTARWRRGTRGRACGRWCAPSAARRASRPAPAAAAAASSAGCSGARARRWCRSPTRGRCGRGSRGRRARRRTSSSRSRRPGWRPRSSSSSR